jgi:hypothetical protein
MRRSVKVLPLIVLAVAAVTAVAAGIWYVLGSNGDSETPVSTLAGMDYPVPKDLDEMARRSDYIIRGTVIKEASTTRQVVAGERGPAFEPVIIRTVMVDEVIKGRATEVLEQILVGETIIEDVLFLRRVDRSVARDSIPYDYFTAVGPQAVFLIDFESNKTTPLGHKQAPTTERYQGASVTQFLEEVRQAAARNPYPRATLWGPPQ